MPAEVALLLCTCFVGFLLVLDRKKSAGVSPVLWVPTLWAFYCASRPLGTWFPGDGIDRNATTIEEGSTLDRMVLGLMILIGVAILLRRKLNWREVFHDNPWIVLLYGFMALSILWSDYPFVSFKRWVKAFGSLLMAWVVLTEPSPSVAIQTILRRVAYVLLPYSMLLLKYYPFLGIEYGRWTGERMWLGVTTQKNNLGVLSMMSAFYLIWTLYQRWREGKLQLSGFQNLVDLSILALALYLLKGPPDNYSATSTATLLMAVWMLFVLYRAHDRKEGRGYRMPFAVLIAGITLGISIPLVGGGWFGGALELLGRDATFTGRTEIWAELLPIAWKSPILGLGYGSFWINPPTKWLLTHSHNGYLEILLELGLIGLALVLAVIVSAYKAARRALRNSFEWAVFGICILTVVVFHEISECSFARASVFLWFVFLLAFTLMPRMARASEPVSARASTCAAGFQTAAWLAEWTAASSEDRQGTRVPTGGARLEPND